MSCFNYTIDVYAYQHRRRVATNRIIAYSSNPGLNACLFLRCPYDLCLPSTTHNYIETVRNKRCS